METEIIGDNHMCIRCKTTINGLENYLEHRKSALCTHVTADAFFSSLQLQQINKSVNKDTEIDYDDDDNNDDVRSNHSSISDDDMYRPPRNFTGGKWKPGHGPAAHCIGQNNYHLRYSSDSDDNDNNDNNDNDTDEVTHKDKRINVKFHNQLINDDQSNRLSFTCASINDNCDDVFSSPLSKDYISLSPIISNAKRKRNYLEDYESEGNDNLVNNNGDDRLTCEKCKFIGKDEIVLLKHLLQCKSESTDNRECQLIKCENNLNNEMAFVCHHCSFYTNQSNNFIWHITRVAHLERAGDTHFYCIACHYNCVNVKSLINHLKSKHSIHMNRSGQIIQCKSSIYGITNNKQTSKKSERYPCPYCDKQFSFKTQLKRHVSNEHISKAPFPNLIISDSYEENPKFSCQKCQFKSNSEAILLLHTINHELPIDSDMNKINNCNEIQKKTVICDSKRPIISGKRKQFKYKCPKCDNLYNCRDMKSHIYVHTNEKPFECDNCDKKFTNISYLRAHKKRHNTIKDKICEICGGTFVLQKSLNKHLAIHSNDREKNFQCETCGMKHYSKSLLMQHMKRHIPKSERKFKCTFKECRYSFVCKNELKEHMKVHNDPEDKPFLCDQCPYKTKSIFSFRKHYRLHTGVKPFKCEHCNYTTALSSNLIRHSRVHTGYKPYKCPYCSYTCNTHENVRKHILKTKKHSGLFVYPCEHCNYGANVFADYRKHISDNHSHLHTQHELDSLISQLYSIKSQNKNASQDMEEFNVIYVNLDQ